MEGKTMKTLKLLDKKGTFRLGISGISLIAAAGAFSMICLEMPGDRNGVHQESDAKLAQMLQQDVFYLSETVGQRGFHAYKGLKKAENYIESEMKKSGYAVKRNDYKVKAAEIGKEYLKLGFSPEQVFSNIYVEVKGTEKPDEYIVVGAHYDSVCVSNCKGADDNASGVAATLALARHFTDKPQKCSLIFVAFANEEPPFFHTETMGSMVFARMLKKENRKIRGMIAFDTIGYYSDEPGSQNYPPPLDQYYPNKGNFIAFVSNMSSIDFLRDCIGTFRKNSALPSEGTAVPSFIPGSDWSDHWSFAKLGWNAVMVSNTALYRTPYYHSSQDTWEKLDYRRMALLTDGMKKIIGKIAD